MFESSSSRVFNRQMRDRARQASETSLYFNPREAQGALSTDSLAVAASLFFALACNQPVWHVALLGRSLWVPGTWAFIAALLVVLTAMHFFLLGLVLHRAFAKPLLVLIVVAAAFVVHHVQLHGSLDAKALPNLSHLGVHEWPALFGPPLWADLLFYAGLPLLVLWRVRLARRPWPRALALRGAGLVAAALLGVGSLLIMSGDFELLQREEPALPYLVTPANLVLRLAQFLSSVPAAGILPP